VLLLPTLLAAMALTDEASAAKRATPPVVRGPITVSTEGQFRAAWADRRRTAIVLANDIMLQACKTGDPIRESRLPMVLDGAGHTLRQTCFEKRLLRQDGTGYLELRNIKLTRGGADGPGAAVTTRGEITIIDSQVVENLSEEPGGAIFSMRRATLIRTVCTGNLANDDGGCVYARRGGVQVFDSILSGNLVDGSGGAIGSTGDILVVRSHVDGNTTDGDGGALYTDEDGDITVVDSTVDGNTADGPGGAIFTLDGDVTIINSTLNGNRADDRGGAISGEAEVTIINSTISRNSAVAHVGGGVWARGNLYIANSTVTNNYAEGQGGGILCAGDVQLYNATITNNVAPFVANVGAAKSFTSFGSIIGPAGTAPVAAFAPSTSTSCRVSNPTSQGYNVVNDASCGLATPTDVVVASGATLGDLLANGGPFESRMPPFDSVALDRIPAELCGFAPFADGIEGEQHLAGLVDRAALRAGDQRGVPRPQGTACDAGAIEREVAAQ
jgi:predicted outer membrane repeat protein